MKPSLDRLLERTAAHLLTQVAPAQATYDQSNIMILAMMLTAAREELERAASRRVEENRALRRIFAEAAAVVGPGPLQTRLRQVASREEEGLRVSDLERSNAELRTLLIDLHARVEEIDSPQARHIEKIIWRELVTSTERRRLSMGPF